MPDELTADWSQFERAFERRRATSKKGALELGIEQLKGIMREVIKVTQPGHDGLEGGTRVAMQHGQAKVMSDIRSLYGTPGDAYDLIKQSDPTHDGGFWKLYKTGQMDRAAEILKATTGKWFGSFDGGQLHQRNRRNGTVKRSKGRPIIFVSNPKELDAYIKEKQDHVMYLSAGWKAACQQLHITLPGFISKHDAPGHIAIEVSDARIRLVASNEVSYSLAIGLQRRIQYAIDAQTGKMDRQWKAFLAKLNATNPL